MGKDEPQIPPAEKKALERAIEKANDRRNPPNPTKK